MLHTLTALKPFRSAISNRTLAPHVREAWLKVTRSNHWAPLIRQISQLRSLAIDPYPLDVSGESVQILIPSESISERVNALCKQLIPWRIGPYQLGGFTIDSEWCSQHKWNRLAPLLGSVEGTRVADVGCSSGYFLFKLSALSPELAVGFDPIERCWLQFALLHGLTRLPNLGLIPTGVATIDAFPDFFDLILCMGVIYHQRDPFSACKKLFSATRTGGRVVLESLVIPGDESHVLVPRERYAKMRNAWSIPTASALANFAIRAGFSDPVIYSFGPVSTSEQRRTVWAPYESLREFLDPSDPTKTVEGYPAPHSAVVIATKL